VAAAVTYTYDQANRLTVVGTTVTYTYDADCLRSSKTVSGTTTAETWDKASPTPVLLVDGSTDYVYGPGGLPLQQFSPTGSLYYYHDQLGSTRALANPTGTVVAAYTYDAYGALTGSTVTGTVSNPFGFTGVYTDQETAFLYLRARYYDPATAEFLSVDPLVQMTQPPYRYAGDNPLNATDPTGLFCILGTLNGPGTACRGRNLDTDLKVGAAVLGGAALILGTGGIALGALPALESATFLGVEITAEGLSSASTLLSAGSTLTSGFLATADCSQRIDRNCLADIAEAFGGATTTGLSAVAGVSRAALGFGADLLGSVFDALAFANFEACH